MASSSSNLLITGLIAIFLLALAFLGLAVGWLITGRSRLQRRWILA